MATRNKPTQKVSAAKSVDAYLAAAPKGMRAALRNLRKTIKAAAPRATEGISYGIAGFKYNGKALVYFGYWKEHCSIYGVTRHFVDANAAALEEYEQRKGTIRFAPNKPLPARLVTRMVKARVAELDGD